MAIGKHCQHLEFLLNKYQQLSFDCSFPKQRLNNSASDTCCMRFITAACPLHQVQSSIFPAFSDEQNVPVCMCVIKIRNKEKNTD